MDNKFELMIKAELFYRQKSNDKIKWMVEADQLYVCFATLSIFCRNKILQLIFRRVIRKICSQMLHFSLKISKNNKRKFKFRNVFFCKMINLKIRKKNKLRIYQHFLYRRDVNFVLNIQKLLRALHMVRLWVGILWKILELNE